MDCITGMMWNKICLEPPISPLSGVSRYLMPLWVSKPEDPQDGPCKSDSSQSIITATGFELQTVNHFSYRQVSIMYKIRAALKCLTFREQHVLVQFWSPREVGKHHLLTTNDQPFGVGVPTEELCFYRRDSEHQVYLVDKDHEEEDISPIVRVFRRGLPEWTSDLTNYKTKDFPQQECAIRYNLHGYLALPVFDPTTGLCVGVLELLTSANYTSYAFEVQQVHKALKAENLLSPQVFDCPTPKALYERKLIKLEKIFNILKTVCDSHKLPLAQTWTVSPTGCFVSNKKVIEKTCSSFDTRCIGKVCMSTTGLPFHVRDMGMWDFRNAYREQHLDKYRGLVEKALLARGSCFCGDVTKLDEEEYPLVHYARMSKLTSCFTIFLRSVECDDDDDGDYVLEFFLPTDDNDPKRVLNLVQTLKQNVELASGFELGETSRVQVIEPPMDINHLFSNIEPDSVQTSSNTTASTSTDTSDSEAVSSDATKTDPADVTSHWLSNQYSTSMQTMNDTVTDAGKKNEQRRKRTIDSMTVEAVDQHVGKPLGQTAEDVSRSKLKRVCRKQGVSSSPMSKYGSSFVYASSLRDVVHGSNTGLLMVKASFKDDIVKFRFRVSRGFVGLQNEVVKRMNFVKGERFKLKYEDEEKDLVMITCDADLEFMASNTTIKLLVEIEIDL